MVWKGGLTLNHTIPTFNDPETERFLKSLWKKEKHFLPFPQCFLPFPNQFSILHSQLFCCLPMLLIWTSLRVCHLVKSYYKCKKYQPKSARVLQQPDFGWNCFWSIFSMSKDQCASWFSWLIPFPSDNFFTLPNSKRWQTTILDLMKMAESSPNRWEKQKLFVTSNFSFSHCVFKRLVQQTHKNQGLCGKGLIPFPNKPLFFHVCSTRLLKTMWEKEKLLITFPHNVFDSYRKFSANFIKLKNCSLQTL